MRWNLPLCVALLLTPSTAWAQSDDPPLAPAELTPEELADDGSAAPPEEGTLSDAPDPEEAVGPEGTDGSATPTTTSAVTINVREAELRREQEQMLDSTEAAAQQDDPDDQDAEEGLDHELQLGLRGGIGVPFLFALRYSGGSECNSAHDQFCVGVGSTVATFDLSFGVSADIEIVAGGRVGIIGVEPTQTNNVQLLLGLRAYISPEQMAKLYLAPSVILDLTEAGNPPEPNWNAVDFGVRGAFGLQVDLVRYFGLYAEIGVNLMFLRSFTIAPDLQAGLQVRFP